MIKVFDKYNSTIKLALNSKKCILLQTNKQIVMNTLSYKDPDPDSNGKMALARIKRGFGKFTKAFCEQSHMKATSRKFQTSLYVILKPILLKCASVE